MSFWDFANAHPFAATIMVIAVAESASVAFGYSWRWAVMRNDERVAERARQLDRERAQS